MLSDALVATSDDWWVIGSAAVALHGGQVGHLKDIDVLMSARDADALIKQVGATRGEPDRSEQFRSQVFGVWNAPPVPVEVFGGFRLATDDGWKDVAFSSREAVKIGAATLFIPSKSDLIAVLHTFGRPKDLGRAALLVG